MHLIHSALRTQPGMSESRPNNNEKTLRYQAYLAACAKHRDYITEIQKHFPNWVPRFR